MLSEICHACLHVAVPINITARHSERHDARTLPPCLSPSILLLKGMSLIQILQILRLYLQVQNQALSLAWLAKYIYTCLLHLWHNWQSLYGGETMRLEAPCQGARAQHGLESWLTRGQRSPGRHALASAVTALQAGHFAWQA